MDEYIVSTHKPIKLRISIQTKGFAIVYANLYESSLFEDGLSLQEINQAKFRGVQPYNPENSSWKTLSKNEVNGDTILLTTRIEFIIGVNNEEIFDSLVSEAKDSYEAELKVGNIDKFKPTFITKSNYSDRTCSFRTKVKLI